MYQYLVFYIDIKKEKRYLEGMRVIEILTHS